MAISTSAYSPKEFQFLIAEQDAFGTIEASGGNAYHALDVDSVGSPSINPVQALDVRNGSRVLQTTDFFQDVKSNNNLRHLVGKLFRLWDYTYI